MTEKQTNVITLNDIEYKIEDMTEKQQLLLAHVRDLDRKIGNMQFNMDQLVIGKEAFLNALARELEGEPKE